MNLQEVIECLLYPDDRSSFRGCRGTHHPVVFDTAGRFNLKILSVYMNDDGVIHVDIGDKDE